MSLVPASRCRECALPLCQVPALCCAAPLPTYRIHYVVSLRPLHLNSGICCTCKLLRFSGALAVVAVLPEVLECAWPSLLQKFKLGVPIRDMRLMDPNLLTSETGKILVRDNAIVVSVEHVRIIITADMVIIPQDGFEHIPLNIRFNGLLQQHIMEAAQVGLAHFWHATHPTLPAQIRLRSAGSIASGHVKDCLLTAPHRTSLAGCKAKLSQQGC